MASPNPRRPTPRRPLIQRLSRKIAFLTLHLEHVRTARGMKKVYVLRKKAEHIFVELDCIAQLLRNPLISKREELFLLRESERLNDQLDLIHYDAARAWGNAQWKRKRAKGLAHLITLRPWTEGKK